MKRKFEKQPMKRLFRNNSSFYVIYYKYEFLQSDKKNYFYAK